MPVPAPQPKSYGPPAPRPPAATAPAPAAAQQPAKPPEQTSSGFPSIFSKPPAIFGRSGETTAFDARQRASPTGSAPTSPTSVSSTATSFRSPPTAANPKASSFCRSRARSASITTPPSPIELIADGSSVVVRDRKLATQDLYPLSQTPLRFLLADRIDLLRDTNLIGVYADDVFVTVVIEERQILGGTHKVMLMFGAQDYQLRQWTVTDPQGYDTTVAVYNLDTKARPTRTCSASTTRGICA